MKRFSVLTPIFVCSVLSACAGSDGDKPFSKDTDSDQDASKPAPTSKSKRDVADASALDESDPELSADEVTDDTNGSDAKSDSDQGLSPFPTLSASNAGQGSSPGVASTSSSGGNVLAASLESAERAVFRIEATGTFVSPGAEERTSVSGGTGFVIDAEGYAVTNAHVVSGATLLRVQFPGEDDMLNARIVAQSECSDLALLKIDGRSDFPHLQWSDTEATLGLDVMSLGYPLGGELTLTEGIVSKESTAANTAWASIDEVIEHTAIINPGNSGGPLLSADYHVLGINYAGNSYNQYFAIGRSEGQRIIDVLRQGQDIESIGLVGIAVSTDTLSGIWVYSVKAGSPADVTGIEPGDLLTHFGGIPLVPHDGVMTMEDYCDILRTHTSDATIDVRVLRLLSPAAGVWEGQVNGRQLESVTEPAPVPTTSMTTTPTATGVPTDPPQPPPAPEPTTLHIEHPEASISFDVPGTWSDARAFEMERFDSALGHGLGASPNMDAFLRQYTTSGVLVSVWASDAELHDGGVGDVDANEILDHYSAYDDCDRNSERESDATVAIESHTDCDDNQGLDVLDVGIALGGEYTAWIRFQAATDAERDAVEVVLDTLVVDVDHLP